jgi:hypothetical protein
LYLAELNFIFDQLTKNVDQPLHVTPDSLLMTNDPAGLVREPPFITPTPPRALEEKFLGLLMFCLFGYLACCDCYKRYSREDSVKGIVEEAHVFLSSSLAPNLLLVSV